MIATALLLGLSLALMAYLGCARRNSDRGRSLVTLQGFIGFALFFLVLTLLAVPVGRYMYRVFELQPTFLDK